MIAGSVLCPKDRRPKDSANAASPDQRRRCEGSLPLPSDVVTVNC